MTRAGRHAVVIGASMGGLLAARALADHYEQVTVLERDGFPPPGEPRKGVPQGRHTHGLLAKGQEILEELFPGLTRELLDQDAVPVSSAGRLRWFLEGGYHCRFESGFVGLAMSRPRLEAQVRTRVLDLCNVRAVEHCDVVGLVASEDGTRVTGVRVLRRAPRSADEILRADLVVDGGGRGSRTPAWLQALGYPAPAEERIRIGITYTSRFYQRTPAHLAGDVGVFVGATRETRRMAALLAQEGERWIVTLAGYFGDAAPTDEQGFLAFARSLPASDIYEVIKDARPLSEPVTYRFAANQRRRYERLARFPAGLLVFGDAICSFNPIYGQGMTVAALEARTLQQSLAEGTERLAPRFFRQAGKAVDIPWSIAVGGDLRIPEVEGPRSAMTRFMNWYMPRLQIAAQRDPVVTLAFHRVTNLIAPPRSLLHPRIALRVVRSNLRGARRAGSTAPFPVPALPRG